MRLARAMVITLTDDAAAAHQDRANRWIRCGVADAASREFVGSLQVKFVEFGYGHEAGLFVAATTTAPVTFPPARPIASAQSVKVAPVVHTSSTKMQARPSSDVRTANRSCAA